MTANTHHPSLTWRRTDSSCRVKKTPAASQRREKTRHLKTSTMTGIIKQMIDLTREGRLADQHMEKSRVTTKKTNLI